MPRSERSTPTTNGIQYSISQMMHRHTRRTHRLLSSFSELQWEVHNAATLFRAGDTVKEVRFSIHGELSDDFLRDTLRRARNVVVPENDLTREFLDARVPEFHKGKERIWNWKWYKLKCRYQHQWGQYLRSNTDWDWDVAGSLRRLFRIKSSATTVSHYISRSSTAVPECKSMHVSKEGKLSVAVERIPKVVEIQYKTASGKKRYKSVPVNISTEDVSYTASLDDVPGSIGENVQRETGCSKGNNGEPDTIGTLDEGGSDRCHDESLAVTPLAVVNCKGESCEYSVAHISQLTK